MALRAGELLLSIETPNDEPSRKGRSNAILTYETVDNISQSLIKVNAKLDRLDEKLDEVGKEHDDHEVRLRVLERSDHERNGKTGMGAYMFPILISATMLVVAVLNYLKV